MNKAELAKAMVEESQYEITLAMAEDMINSMMTVIKDKVATGNRVQLIGFGTFEPVNRAARKGKNPQTGESLDIPACKVPRFKPGKAFKDALK